MQLKGLGFLNKHFATQNKQMYIRLHCLPQQCVLSGRNPNEIHFGVKHHGKEEGRCGSGGLFVQSAALVQSKQGGINESAKLFERITDPALTVRRITLNANKVTPDEGIYQVDFFTDTKKLEKEKKLQQAMLGIKNKYGKNAVLKASSYEEGATMRQRNAQIGGHSAGGSDGKLQK